MRIGEHELAHIGVRAAERVTDTWLVGPGPTSRDFTAAREVLVAGCERGRAAGHAGAVVLIISVVERSLPVVSADRYLFFASKECIAQTIGDHLKVDVGLPVGAPPSGYRQTCRL